MKRSDTSGSASDYPGQVPFARGWCKVTVAQKTKTETKTDKHRDQLARLRREVGVLRNQLKEVQRLATVGTMAAMVAHEFNNILTPIINYAQLAQKNPELAGKALAQAADGGRRASTICKALLGLTEKHPETPEDVRVDQLIAETLSAMGRDPKRDGIDVIFQGPANLTVETLRVELQQVLLNLLLNAREAVLEKNDPRHIEISTSRCSNDIVIRISDNGVGIPRKNLRKIFEPFFTTKRGREEVRRGHGLGLHVCKQIIETLGGEVTVDSTEGVGTSFIIRLPLKFPNLPRIWPDTQIS